MKRTTNERKNNGKIPKFSLSFAATFSSVCAFGLLLGCGGNEARLVSVKSFIPWQKTASAQKRVTPFWLNGQTTATTVTPTERQKYHDITGEQVLAAIENQYPERFGKLVRPTHRPSDFNLSNVRGFNGTINGVSDVEVTFKNIVVTSPPGTQTQSDTLAFFPVISHADFPNRWMGELLLSGFGSDVVLTKTNYNALLTYDQPDLNVADGVTVVKSFGAHYASAKFLEIPNSLKFIGRTSFQWLTNLQSVNLRNVTFVGAAAFRQSPLIQIVSWNDLEGVGDDAFQNANLIILPGGALPPKITTVGNNAFQRSTFTGVLTIPDSLRTLGASAFREARFSGLRADAVNSALTTVGLEAFAASKMKQIVLPNALETVGEGAFWSSPATTLTLGDHLTSVGSNAFASAVATSLEVPATVVTVGRDAFASSPVTNLTFEGPYRDNLVLGDGAFAKTTPSAINPLAWRQIAKKYPRAFFVPKFFRPGYP